MNEQLDSQLSAMFDDELPQEECELLARRLSRDGELKARWGRYAVMGAAIRAERGVRLNAAVAGRVSAVLLAEPEFGAPAGGAARRGVRWWQPVAGAAVAAGVAAASILWLRAQAPLGAETDPLVASSQAPAAQQLPVVSSQPDSYVTPAPPATHAVVSPGTELANYVVAHSVYSPPVVRPNLLSAFMTSEPAPAGTEDPQGDAKSDLKANAQ
jgi:sigma-E factor negative regulatory protein RseA